VIHSCFRAALLSACATTAVMAQDADKTPEAAAEISSLGDGVTAYQASYFDAFNAVTALDMVQRVPGFSFDSGRDVRGFGGAAGNVLINGERPSSKDGLNAILQRIPASQVARLEHVRGQVAGYDMRGQTEIVNVVRVADSAASGAYEIQLKAAEGAPITLRGNASYSDRLGPWEYTANLERDTNRSIFGGTERLQRVNGDLIERRHEVFKENYRDWEGGVNAEAAFGATTLRLNARGESWTFDGYEPSFVFDDSSARIRVAESDFDDEGYNYDFGGDIERELSEAWSAKLIGLNRFSYEETNQRFDDFPAAASGETVFQSIAVDEGETIARGFLTWTPSTRHSVEFGLEGAYNFRDNALTLSIDDGSGPTPIPLPNANTKVEETRGEAFVSWVWTRSDALTIEPGFVAEYSEIKQSGDAANQRSFTYPKPSLTATWDYAENRQLRLLIERRVAQLDFGDFASSTSINDDQTDLGNPELEPDKSWVVETKWERRFWNEGVVSLRGQYESIQDLLDLLPVTGPNGQRFVARGNIGDGQFFLLEAGWTLPLDRLGVPNALFEGRYATYWSEVTDPLTGQARGISDVSDSNWRIDFRQDLPDRKISWGFDYAKPGQRPFYRLSEIQIRDDKHGDLDMFVETTRYFGLTLRLDVENIGNQSRNRERYFFSAPRDIGQIERIEFGEKNDGALIRLTARGTF